jgi:hypothetical protein
MILRFWRKGGPPGWVDTPAQGVGAPGSPDLAVSSRPSAPRIASRAGKKAHFRRGAQIGHEQEARICWSKALEARPELAQGYFETAK